MLRQSTGYLRLALGFELCQEFNILRNPGSEIVCLSSKPWIPLFFPVLGGVSALSQKPICVDGKENMPFKN